MKTINDLFAEIEEVKLRDLALTVYYSQDPSYYPNTTAMMNQLDVVSLEFRHFISPEKVQQVYEHIKNTYWRVIYDVRLITSNRIHIYLVKKPL